MPALFCVLLLAAGPDGPPSDILAEVAGETITRGRVHLYLTLKNVPEPGRAAIWEETVAHMRERALMRRFLARRRAVPEEAELDAQTAALLGRFGETDGAATAALAELGATPADVRAEAALPLAWEAQARRLITPDVLREHFETNRRRFDGTALTVAHVFRPGDATAELADVKRRIDAGELTFAEAAEQFSEAPTAAGGGVIGPVRIGDGRAPAAVADAAFGLEAGEVSDPVRSAVGTHLVAVLGVAEPGDLALEDVRGRVRRDLKRKLWAAQVAKLR